MGIWPFGKKTDTLKESGLFDGFTDWHSHILPGVDDGVKTFDESCALLDAFGGMGVRKIWLTPHIMEDYPNTTADLRKRFEELKLAYDGPVELCLASENMLDSLFEDRLSECDFLPIGDEGKHILVETSYFSAPINMTDLLQEVMRKGYYPVLAHPERYRYMDENRYTELHEMGVVFQSNLLSIVGGYGDTARKKLEWLLRKGYVSMMGSDIHRLSTLEQYDRHPGRREHLERLVAVAANPRLG